MYERDSLYILVCVLEVLKEIILEAFEWINLAQCRDK
jgi:hypothetical protein